jgi:hypothetical protein
VIELPAGRGRVEGFTLTQDLERRCLFVSSKRYRIRIDGSSLSGDLTRALTPVEVGSGHVEHLFCGCHKKQEWEAIRRRRSLAEILPFWHTLSQMAPLSNEKGRGEVFEIDDLLDLFDAGFGDLMVPRLVDTDYLGIIGEEGASGDPFSLFPHVAKRIRSLFIDEEQRSILPAVPKELHAGTYFNVVCGDLELDIEWSKKRIRRMVIRAHRDCEETFRFKGGVKQLRLRSGGRGRGRHIPVGTPLSFEGGKSYLLDRFEA